MRMSAAWKSMISPLPRKSYPCTHTPFTLPYPCPLLSPHHAPPLPLLVNPPWTSPYVFIPSSLFCLTCHAPPPIPFIFTSLAHPPHFLFGIISTTFTINNNPPPPPFNQHLYTTHLTNIHRILVLSRYHQVHHSALLVTSCLGVHSTPTRLNNKQSILIYQWVSTTYSPNLILPYHDENSFKDALHQSTYAR